VVGEVVRGRYEIVQASALGGEGRVVKAIDRQHDRTVALKIRPATNGAAELCVRLCCRIRSARVRRAGEVLGSCIDPSSTSSSSSSWVAAQ
jgi:hypothetical protein